MSVNPECCSSVEHCYSDSSPFSQYFPVQIHLILRQRGIPYHDFFARLDLAFIFALTNWHSKVHFFYFSPFLSPIQISCASDKKNTQWLPICQDRREKKRHLDSPQKIARRTQAVIDECTYSRHLLMLVLKKNIVVHHLKVQIVSACGAKHRGMRRRTEAWYQNLLATFRVSVFVTIIIFFSCKVLTAVPSDDFRDGSSLRLKCSVHQE